MPIIKDIYELQTIANAAQMVANNRYAKVFELDWTLCKEREPTADELEQFYLLVKILHLCF